MDREAVDEIKRHFGVVAGQLRSDVQAVAEGQHLLARDIGTIRTEVAREGDETRALIRLSYGELDRRIRSLESELTDLRSRLERAEARLAS